jgi:hypothetical protein
MKDDLRNKFIVDESHVRQNTERFIEKALKFGRVSKGGDIIIDKTHLSQDNILKLALVLRYLGHSLDETIADTVRPSELTKVMGERIESVGSRLSQLAKNGFAKKSGYGQYVVQSYRVEKFLDELAAGGGDGVSEQKHNGKRKGRRTSNNKKSLPLVGIGSDIQGLIDAGFFKTPKFVIEVQRKLEEEVRYHDIRVIDTAIRKTFVASRKVLKRIPNAEKGKAKWKYVNR